MRYTYNPQNQKSQERIRAEQLGFKYSKLMEQNKKLEGIFSPVNICVAIASIMLLGSLLQSLNIF
jgi:hypothetical protein